jgi:hypothetical protein
MKLNLTTTAIAGAMALSTLAAAPQALAQAQEPARTVGPYTTVEGWDIYAPTEQLGCMMERVVDNGYFVRMGKVKDTNAFGYLAVYTQDESVKVFGNVVADEVVFDLDGKRFRGSTTNRLLAGGWRGGSVKANNPNFGEALAKAYVLTLNPDGDNPIKISLAGTFKAIAETQACDNSQ